MRNKLFYYIKWLGADEDLEQYLYLNTMTAPYMIKRFHLEHPNAKGPLRALLKWLEAYNASIDDYNDLENDTVMATIARTQFFRRGG